MAAGWSEPERVAHVVEHPATGRQVVGWESVREACGCRAWRGKRLDTMEDTFGLAPCALHRGEAARALAAWRAMPPSDREVFGLMAELLDAEVGG